MKPESINSHKILFAPLTEQEYWDIFRKLQDGILPQARILEAKVFPKHVRIRYRRFYLQRFAPTFLCFVTQLEGSSHIVMHYKRGVTLISWTWFAILLCYLYLMIYGVIQYGVDWIFILVGVILLSVILYLVVLREGRLQAVVKEKMLQSIREVVAQT